MVETKKKKRDRLFKRRVRNFKRQQEREEIASVIRTALDKQDGKAEPSPLDDMMTPEEFARDGYK